MNNSRKFQSIPDLLTLVAGVMFLGVLFQIVSFLDGASGFGMRLDVVTSLVAYGGTYLAVLIGAWAAACFLISGRPTYLPAVSQAVGVLLMICVVIGAVRIGQHQESAISAAQRLASYIGLLHPLALAGLLFLLGRSYSRKDAIS